MENRLVTADGTKVLTVEEYDRFVQTVPNKFRPISNHTTKGSTKEGKTKSSKKDY